MAVSRTLYLTTRTRRKALTYIFGATAFASVLTVAASDVLPCPVKPNKGRYAEGKDGEEVGRSLATGAVIERRPVRRWIEERRA